MLSKVSNIATNDLLQQKSSEYRKKNSFKTIYEKYKTTDDEAELSPAVKYLSKLGWSLKSLDYEEDQKLSFSFSTGGFVFFSTIEFLRSNIISNIKLNIKNETDNSILLFFDVPVTNRQVYEKETNLSFDSLKNLFARINYAKEVRGNNLNDALLKSLYIDLLEPIDAELKQVAGLIIEFVIKFLPYELQFEENLLSDTKIKLTNVKIC
ncbi:hypothetical protein ABRY23_12550 [Melioribacteraceae bacterium 4301-Me]|uniref:hypothetical protein n=1 Tax=Pyranulibacter aquaticus TaxID=3163344 RepID=UPI00359A575F